MAQYEQRLTQEGHLIVSIWDDSRSPKHTNRVTWDSIHSHYHNRCNAYRFVPKDLYSGWHMALYSPVSR